MIVKQLKRLAMPIASLKEDPRNARLHGDRNIESIKVSLERFGQRKPVVALVDGTIIAGNGTYRAAIAAGWKELAVVQVDDDPRTAAAFAIADNRTAELATWDNTTLSELIRELRLDEDNLALASGFTDDEQRAILDAFDRDAPPPEAWGKEHDATVGDDVDMIDCPHCGGKVPV